ncbi:MAG TPA: hypothetical protein VFQ25_04755 [Ktedonobacterales bacterium]|nr:hypothetical protein [Ktedonobacterales bacterium]
MGAAGAQNAYLDTGEYLRATTNQETASLLGLNTMLTASVAPGATALPVTASAGWAAGPLWLLDGPYSEVVQVVTAPDGVTLTLAASGVALAHAAGVSASQAGQSGALAEIILRASAWAENHCRQGAPGSRSLFALPRMERWGLPGAHAWGEPDGGLTVRPAHFPAQTVTSLTIEAFPGASAAVDVTQVELTASGSLIEVPGSALPPIALMGGSPRRWVTLGYTGGVTPGAVPGELRQAVVWVVSDFLAQRRNPSGAAFVRMGSFALQARPRDDPSGDSILLIQAKAALQPWRMEW